VNPREKQNELRWKECLRSLQERAKQFGTAGNKLIESASDWNAVKKDAGGNTKEARSIVAFRSPEISETFFVDQTVQERAVLGPRFYVRSLLPHVLKPQCFYLLALSQRNTRLLYCTSHSSEEVPFPAGINSDFEAWMNQAKPDHNAVYNAMSSSAQGLSGPNALAPKGADQEAKGEYLSHFFKQIDRGVNEVLKGKTEPLVLCAVEYQIPLYREVNRYPNLLSAEVRGAPNGLKAGEMHARALEALDRAYASEVDEAIADWNHRVGSRASSRLKDVVTAAHDGRVLTLLVSDSLEQIGTFDEETHNVKGRETKTAGDEDLINDAVIQAILHAGQVFLVPHSKMPHGSGLAATFRY
jgi:Bacterial archaeo-eukaryotic release factor family 3